MQNNITNKLMEGKMELAIIIIVEIVGILAIARLSWLDGYKAGKSDGINHALKTLNPKEYGG